MNYFSYFSEIEDTFVRRRGKHLLLSPMDWALIESWKERGVPLHVALRGIEHAFDSYEAKKRKRSVKTLLYCQEEVEAQYAEWLESRVGGHDEATINSQEAEPDDSSPFPRATILAHLAQSRQTLKDLFDERRRTVEDELSEALSRSESLLKEIEEDYASTALPDTRKLEESLTGIERLLDAAIRLAAAETVLAPVQQEVDAQLQPYKRQMDKAAYEQTRDNLVRKRLREHFDVPRLSLFFL